MSKKNNTKWHSTQNTQVKNSCVTPSKNTLPCLRHFFDELQTIYGIGTVYSERIIRFRDSFEAGFMSELQLEGVYGLSPELIDNILKKFTLKTPMYFKKINPSEYPFRPGSFSFLSELFLRNVFKRYFSSLRVSFSTWVVFLPQRIIFEKCI